MSTYFCEIDFLSPAYDECYQLRKSLLRDPLGMEFFLKDIKQECQYRHFALYRIYDDALIGTAMVKDVMKNGKQFGQIKQVCTQESLQGHGYGYVLMKGLEMHLADIGYRDIFLHARSTVKTFYDKCKYMTVGDPFYEVEIEHFYMEKSLL